ncbi:unnamed protein product, partial [Mesorhabditis spiculigera]
MSYFDYSHFQNRPEEVKQSLTYMITKASEAKRIIEDLIYLLNQEESVPYPDMLEKFTSVVSTFSQLQTSFRRSGIPTLSQEDHGLILRTNVLVPQLLSLEPNPQLQETLENRVHSWNHEVAPVYLSTKGTPEIENEEAALEQERQSKAHDLINKQISAMNKHVDALVIQLQALEKLATNEADAKPTYSEEETRKLVRAIMNGDTISIRPAKVQPQNVPPGGMMGQQPPVPGMPPMMRR